MITAIELCKRFEGFRPKPYICPAGVPTIGYGTTRYPNGTRVTLDDAAISEDQATDFLMYDLERFAIGMLKLCPVLANEPEARFGAVLSWTYNLGLGNFQISTFRQRLTARKWEEAASECRRWFYGGGKRQPGLVIRRNIEAGLIAKGEW